MIWCKSSGIQTNNDISVVNIIQWILVTVMTTLLVIDIRIFYITASLLLCFFSRSFNQTHSEFKLKYNHKVNAQRISKIKEPKYRVSFICRQHTVNSPRIHIELGFGLDASLHKRLYEALAKYFIMDSRCVLRNSVCALVS